MLILLPDTMLLLVDTAPRHVLQPEDRVKFYARVRTDLTALFPDEEVAETPGRLWCYWVAVERGRAARIVAALALSVDYRSVVASANQQWRQDVYRSVLDDIAMRPARRSARPSLDTPTSSQTN